MYQEFFFKMLTAPVRFVLGFLQMWAFFALVAVASIVYPFYLVFTHQPTTPLDWIAAGLVVMLLASLVRSPFYTVFVGIAATVTFAICLGVIPGFLEQVMVIYHPYRIYWLIFWFLFIGIFKPRMSTLFAARVQPPTKPIRKQRSRRIKVQPEYLPPLLGR